MQGTTDCHEQIADARLPQAAGVADDTAALDAAVDVFDTHAAARNTPIRRFLRARQGPAPRLLGRHDDLDLRECKRQEAQILEQPTAWRQWVGCCIRNALVMDTARIRVTQKEDGECRVDQQHVFDRVARFLATVTARLLSRLLGALDAPFGAILAKRGETGAAVGATAGGAVGVSSSSVGTTMAAASASATPIRWASAVKDRVGASPSMRSVVCKTTKRT